jgi:hypothetical protein
MNKFFGIASIIVLSVATWLTLSHHPISDKINAWQAEMMGDNKYFPALTIFLLALPPLLLLLGIKKNLLYRAKNNYTTCPSKS